MIRRPLRSPNSEPLLLLVLLLAGPACSDRRVGPGAGGPGSPFDAALFDSAAPTPDLGFDAGADTDTDTALDANADGETDGGTDASADSGPPPECSEPFDCDDGLYCNGVERCSEGRCFDAPNPPCFDGVPCSEDRCIEVDRACRFIADDTACAPDQSCDLKVGCIRTGLCHSDENCDDGLICNGEERCVDDQCRAGEPMECADEIECTLESCVEELGACQIIPIHGFCLPTEWCSIDDDCVPRPGCVSDDECDDGFFCNGIESCDEETGVCNPAQAPAVDDGIECTIDLCSEDHAMVLHTPNNARCSDGAFCNGAEQCHPQDGCVPGAPPVLSDGVACTEDRCDEALDFIEHLPDHPACDDGSFCNGLEICHPLQGCAPGEPLALNDGVGCTIDTCSEVEGRVLHTPSDERCDDALFCNGAERCDGEEDCQPGEAPALDDDLECSEGRCDEEADAVVQDLLHARCDNGLFCDGSEQCDPERGCVAGTINLSDELDCTEDSCDEAADQLVHTPRHERCDNQLFCDGVERCDEGQGCVPGAAPSLADDLECTEGRCVEATDQVIQEPHHERCDNQLFCDGAERCDLEQGCVDGSPPPIEDQVACTADRCDEDEDRVVNDPVDEDCDNGLFCDGKERCDETLGCQDGPAPDLGDDQECTRGRCVEASDEVEQIPVDDRCDNEDPCDGAETCDAELGCRPGLRLQDGAVCAQAPRSICLDGACAESACGDSYLDEAAGEACEDGNRAGGDGCDANCQLEGDGGLEGIFGVEPTILHNTCSVIIFGDLVRVDISRFEFATVVGQLQVTAWQGRLQNGIDNLHGPIVMNPVAGPLPLDMDFQVEHRIPGGCTEIYALEGRLTGPDSWTGEFSVSFQGAQCGGCAHRTVAVTGTRIP